MKELLEDATAGDPIKGTKWTRKTLRALARELGKIGFQVGRETLRRLLRDFGYKLRSNRKRLTRKQDPERDRQFRYITRQRRAFYKAGRPVISVDAKKKELVGNFKQAGRTWRQAPLDVLEKDYPNLAEGKAIPYGIYDVQANEGMVIVGISAETAQFAVAAIRRWWLRRERRRYAGQNQLLIEADSGGANGSRSWLWKAALQEFADEFNLTITVAHFPPGASKWNLVEHRLFCYISANWAGQPLLSYETVLKFIRTTKTDGGLRCRAYLDKTEYQTGLKISPAEKKRINLKPHRVLPKWNYTIYPRKKIE